MSESLSVSESLRESMDEYGGEVSELNVTTGERWSAKACRSEWC